jgi:hypothetical protein
MVYWQLMTDSHANKDGIDVPKPGNWPGAFESFKLVKPHIKPQIWNFVSVIGLSIAVLLLLDIVFSIVFKNTFMNTALKDLASLLIGSFMEAVIITMFFASLRGDEFTLQTAINYGLQRLLKMIGLIFIMYVIMLVSFILLVIPLFFVAPRVLLAPYYLILNDCTVGEALAASWHSTKGQYKNVYGIIGIQVLVALAFITIVGIPFAIYWGIINSGSFALLTLYLSQSKDKTDLQKA